MWELWKNKIDQSKVHVSVDKKNIEDMIKGFVVHNAADKLVHWNFFKGAGMPIPNAD